MSASARRLIGTLITLLLLVGLAPTAVTQAGSTLPGHFGGQAWAAQANAKAGDLAVRLGRSAYQPCPCLGTDGNLLSNTITDVSLNDVASLDVTEATARASKGTDATATVRMTARVAGLSLLDGRITADAVKAVATTNADPSAIRSSSGGSRLVNLRVLGNVIDATVAPGTRISLPGIGFVGIREVERIGNGAGRGGIHVTMLHIRVTLANSLGLPVGTDIRIAEATSVYDRSPVTVTYRGAAWGASAKDDVGPLANRIGKAAVVYVPCEGTGGRTKTNVVAAIHAGSLLQAGQVTSTRRTWHTGSVYGVRTSSRVEGVSLLGGAITLSALVGVAKATYDTATSTGRVSSVGSQLLSLHIDGVLDLPVTIPPNTTVPLPLFGSLVLYERSVENGPDGPFIAVTMLHLTVDTPNLLGIPVGTELLVGAARAGVNAP